MGTSKTIAASVVGFTVASASLWSAADQLADLMQPGQPSKQPAPKNPSPRPSNPTPRPADPTPDPNSPGAPNKQPDQPADKEGEKKEKGTNRERSIRPFAFQSPDVEGRFNQSTRKLALMERRMQKSNEDLLKRLGEARQLTGERQTTAVMDVLQQILKDQADLQRYLIAARAGWAGDVDVEDTRDEAAAPDQNEAPRNER